MDIDIDVSASLQPKKLFNKAINASLVEKGKLRRHPCGFYFQSIPIDQVTGLSAIPYKSVEAEGFTKIDFLHLSILDRFTTKQEINYLLSLTVDWSLFEDEEVVKKLFHIGNHFHLVKRVKPKSVQELADILALIRPAKKHLVDDYVKDREATRVELYKKSKSYSFKKSHAHSYAMDIILDLQSQFNK